MYLVRQSSGDYSLSETAGPSLARRAAVVVKVTEVGCNQGSDQSGSRRYSVAISTDRRIFFQE